MDKSMWTARRSRHMGYFYGNIQSLGVIVRLIETQIQMLTMYKVTEAVIIVRQ